MSHLAPFIRDLALILVCAGVVTVLFRSLGQPTVLGYLVAGLLVGPGVPRFPTILDLPNIQVAAEIGVIFLLFGLGLEFSVRKLFGVGRAALTAALVEVGGMIAIGYGSGWLLGWGSMDSLFLGGILAISSTTIILRTFDELGIRRGGFTDLVFAILVVEDLVAILLMVILSAVGSSLESAGTELLWTAQKLFLFIGVAFPLGLFLIPRAFRRIRSRLNDETLLVLCLGLCFAMVVLAAQLGFSAALGAFLMGSILAESDEVKRIETLLSPLKSLFGAIFFTSVGMLIAPETFLNQLGVILLLTVITVLGKFLTTFAGARLSGRDASDSVKVGLSLAQIGEFSFIIATLGLSLKVTSDFLYPIAIGVSVITTFLTPYLIRSAPRVQGYLAREK